MVSRPHRRHTPHDSRLRNIDRPIHRLPRRNGGGFPTDAQPYARSRLRLVVHVPLFGTPRHLRLEKPARQHSRRRENRTAQPHDCIAERVVVGVEPPRHRPQVRRAGGGRVKTLARPIRGPHAAEQDGCFPPRRLPRRRHRSHPRHRRLFGHPHRRTCIKNLGNQYR